MKIICISGKAGAGKDTLAKCIELTLAEAGQRVLITHYADLVKYVCKTFFKWDGNKDEKGRTLLQKVGTDIVRSKDPNFWVNFIEEILYFFQNEWDCVIIPDTRFPNEIQNLISAGHDVYHVRITRPIQGIAMTDKQKSHSSETALDKYSYDYVIHNSGDVNSLCIKADNFLRTFKIINCAE